MSPAKRSRVEPGLEPGRLALLPRELVNRIFRGLTHPCAEMIRDEIVYGGTGCDWCRHYLRPLRGQYDRFRFRSGRGMNICKGCMSDPENLEFLVGEYARGV